MYEKAISAVSATDTVAAPYLCKAAEVMTTIRELGERGIVLRSLREGSAFRDRPEWGLTATRPAETTRADRS